MNRSQSWLAVSVLILAPAVARAQVSDGSDGALNITTSGVFDPVALGLHGTGVANNVFNFTTVTVASGVTVKFKSNLLHNQAVIWLATQDVNILGTLDLTGESGYTMSPTDPGLTRSPSQPGPGGFPGGVGAYLNSPPTNGGGYGGGLGGGVNGNTFGGSGVYSYYNTNLTPLYGGPGGGGGALGSGTAGGNGGAGGGAIRIVSATTVNLNGTIDVSGGGGNSGVGGWGAGSGCAGAIHIIAPTFSGTGNTNSYSCSGCVVQINTNNNTFTGNINGISAQNIIVRPLFNPPLPSGVPSITVVSLNSTPAPSPVTASYQVPDFSINTSAAVTVNIAAKNVPTGTVVKLYLTSDQGNDQVITCQGLSGSLASSTASCTGVAFPPGITITDILAVW